MSGSPTFSIIMPLLNRASMLPDALASLTAQGETSYELLVIDGGSTDGSEAIAAEAGAQVTHAPGSSIYEAINLGLARATGEYVCFLNSDDRLAPGALPAVDAAFRSAPDADFVCGRAGAERIENGQWQIFGGSDATPARSPLRRVLRGPSNINACFFRAQTVRALGAFDTRYRISADREWLLRAILSGASPERLDQVVYVYRAHAGSLTIGDRKPALHAWLREHIAFAREALSRPDLSAGAIDELRAFAAKETAHLALVSLAAREPMKALTTIWAGFKGDMLWPMRAVGPIAEIAKRRLMSALS